MNPRILTGPLLLAPGLANSQTKPSYPPRTFSEHFAFRTDYGKIRDKAVSAPDLKDRRAATLTLLTEALKLAEWTQKHPVQQGWNGEDVVVRTTLSPVLIEFAQQGLKKCDAPIATTHAAATRKFSSMAIRFGYKAGSLDRVGAYPTDADYHRCYESVRRKLPPVSASLRAAISSLRSLQ
ncbi:MAG: hypothetical protein C4320_07680 [Armatimonadota bacterium]